MKILKVFLCAVLVFVSGCSTVSNSRADYTLRTTCELHRGYNQSQLSTLDKDTIERLVRERKRSGKKALEACYARGLLIDEGELDSWGRMLSGKKAVGADVYEGTFEAGKANFGAQDRYDYYHIFLNTYKRGTYTKSTGERYSGLFKFLQITESGQVVTEVRGKYVVGGTYLFHGEHYDKDNNLVGRGHYKANFFGPHKELNFSRSSELASISLISTYERQLQSYDRKLAADAARKKKSRSEGLAVLGKVVAGAAVAYGVSESGLDAPHAADVMTGVSQSIANNDSSHLYRSLSEVNRSFFENTNSRSISVASPAGSNKSNRQVSADYRKPVGSNPEFSRSGSDVIKTNTGQSSAVRGSGVPRICYGIAASSSSDRGLSISGRLDVGATHADAEGAALVRTDYSVRDPGGDILHRSALNTIWVRYETAAYLELTSAFSQCDNGPFKSYASFREALSAIEEIYTRPDAAFSTIDVKATVLRDSTDQALKSMRAQDQY